MRKRDLFEPGRLHFLFRLQDVLAFHNHTPVHSNVHAVREVLLYLLHLLLFPLLCCELAGCVGFLVSPVNGGHDQEGWELQTSSQTSAGHEEQDRKTEEVGFLLLSLGHLRSDVSLNLGGVLNGLRPQNSHQIGDAHWRRQANIGYVHLKWWPWRN